VSRIIPISREGTVEGTTPVFQRIAIVGFGLIGGSLALAVRQRWPGGLIIAIDRKDVLETAMRMHAADVGGDDLVMLAEADLIVLAAPIKQNIRILNQLPEYVAGDALVTDVGSTKQATMSAARQALPERLRFIGGHPLAGAAIGGLDAARPDLFAGRPWLLTPDSPATAADIERLESFIAHLGAVPRRIDARDHDRLLAYLSHLPQVTVSALMHVVGERVGAAGLALAGRGFRDTTRLASSPADIWQDIVATNETEVRAALDDLIAVCDELRRSLQDPVTIERVFGSAARWKRQLEHEDSS
jgi:prephenate dehydrogenase